MAIAGCEIRAMIPADLDVVSETTLSGGFGDRREFFSAAILLSSARPIVAVLGARIVGTGLATIHGPAGWVGVIFVVPELRRRGIGTELTRAACSILEAAGCESLVLVATDLGRPTYDRLGFREQTRYHMFGAEPLSAAPTPPPGTLLKPVQPADLDALFALDRRATGEDRRPLIERYAANGWLLDRGGAVAGFLLPTVRGNSALVAPESRDAACLLDLHRHLTPAGGRAWAGLLSENETGRRSLAEMGWLEWRSFPRMVRGPDLDWQPSLIWGQFNHAMG
jgi:predicted N-acetyltransferase YhbS